MIHYGIERNQLSEKTGAETVSTFHDSGKHYFLRTFSQTAAYQKGNGHCPLGQSVFKSEEGVLHYFNREARE